MKTIDLTNWTLFSARNTSDNYNIMLDPHIPAGAKMY